ncbi:MAG: hypothetical protein H6739_26560 [Alphaproteobacteria bacterium]|nr:hypothetical protein [Alphaproteobacteria bacterium]
MQQKQIAESYHFSISLGRALFSDLLGAALPFRLAGGRFNVVDNLRQVAHQLQVKERVAGLLEGPRNDTLLRIKDKGRDLWGERREQFYEALNELVRIEGDWEVSLDKDGSEFKYAHQEIGAEAYFKVVATGKAVLLKDNLELPFTLEKRVGAEIHLGDIRFDQDRKQVVGTLTNLGIDLGDNLALRLANDALIKLLEQQSERFNPVPILKKEQLDGLVGSAATALKLKMEVTDVALEISEEQATLKVRFGFTQLQLED